MHFQEDSISDFISYKLNNPQALQKEMKLIQDRKQCLRKLDQYAKQMDVLRSQLTAHQEILETLTSRRSSIQNSYTEQLNSLDRQIQDCKQKIQFTKKATKEKLEANQVHKKNFQQFQKEIVIKKQQIIQQHTAELTELDEEADALIQKNEEKKQKRALLEQQLKKLKDRERIINNTKQNVEVIRNKWKIKQSELEAAKQQQNKKEQQIDQLIRYSKSMEKVIYGNLYKRCTQVVNEMKNHLSILYSFQNSETKEFNWDEHLDKLLTHLKNTKEKIAIFIKEKRQKYKVGSATPEPEPKQYNFIVETKITPELLPVIDSDKYVTNEEMYHEIEDGQNSMLDSLEKEKEDCFARERAVEQQIQNLQKRIVEFEDQIQVKRRSILSPPKKKS